MPTRHLFVLLPVLALAACAARTPRPEATPADRSHRVAVELAARAETAQKAGQWPQSVALNREAISINPALGSAWHNLGVGLMQTGEHLEAASCFQRAAELLTSDPRPFESLALLHMKQGWHADALRLYDLSLERSTYWLPSLRGAVQAAKDLNESTDAGLDRIRRGLLVEKDPQWRRLFESEQVRVSQDLAEARRRESRPN